jgi:hypothetical protein
VVTDTRLPEHYLTDPRLDALDDAAYRVFINGLMWSVTHGTDGVLPALALRWLHPDAGRVTGAAQTLVAAGLWTQTGNGHMVRDFGKHQSSAETVEHMRKQARERKERQRRHERGDHSLCRPEHCESLSRNGVTRDSSPSHGVTGRVTTEDRTGSAVEGELAGSGEHANGNDQTRRAACCEDHAVRYGPRGSPMCTDCWTGSAATA